ncbi:MAG TPA: proton-conducting transporter membrane subunit [Polyangiaceae bacterium]
MMSPLLLLLSVPVLLIGAAVSLGLRANRASGVVSISTQAVATVLVLMSVTPVLRGRGPVEVVWPWSAPIESIAFRVDALGAFFLSFSLPMTLLGTVYATAYLKPYFVKGRHGGPHFALLNMLSISFVIIYSVQNALVFLLGWEIAAISAWLLIIWDYQNQKVRFAGFNYLVSTHLGLFILAAAFMLLNSKTGAMDFRSFGVFLSQPSRDRGTLFLVLGVSFGLKSAFFPFHTWLPRAHSAAPAHISALLSGVVSTAAGLFGFLRFTLFMERPDEWMGWVVLTFGTLSAFFGVLYTTTQRDLKRLLAYSSTENVGIAAMGFGVGYLGWTWGIPALAMAGFAGGLLHLLNHALFKCLLFYGAGSVYRATHTVDIERLGGLAKRLPITAVLFLIGALAISALPPFNGFISELIIYSGLLSGRAPSAQGNMVLIAAAATLAFVGAVSALSMTRAFGLTFLGNAREPGRHVAEEAPGSMLGPMVLHAVGAVVIGVAPGVGVGLTSAVLDLFPFAPGGHPVLDALMPAVWASRGIGALLLLACLVGWRRGVNARRSVTWGCGYTAASPRMQYTGSAFAEHFARIFESFLPVLRRDKLPEGPFPTHPGHVGTHHADPVERRMFEVLGQGEDLVTRASERISEQPRFAFVAGLITLVVIGVLTFGAASR